MASREDLANREDASTEAPSMTIGVTETKACIRCMQHKSVTVFAKPGRKDLLKTCSNCLVSHTLKNDKKRIALTIIQTKKLSSGQASTTHHLPSYAASGGDVADFKVVPQVPHIYKKPRLHVPKEKVEHSGT